MLAWRAYHYSTRSIGQLMQIIIDFCVVSVYFFPIAWLMCIAHSSVTQESSRAIGIKNPGLPGNRSEIRGSMEDSSRKIMLTGLVVALNLAYWLAPSDVAYLVGQQREVLLFRYSEGRLSGQFAALALSLISLYPVWAPNRQARRERYFEMITAGIGLIAGLIILDGGYRLIRTARYTKTAEVYHRPVNQTVNGVYRDRPKTRFTYANAAPGYPDVRYTLTTDGQGFRNSSDQGRHQIVVLGDSFVEGSKVSDSETWPSLYAKSSGRTLYNLGMSGTDPAGYVQTMKRYGGIHQPEMVLCMIYEGNDFRGSGELVDRVKERETLSRQIERYLDNSPIRLAAQQGMIRAFSFANQGPSDHAPPQTAMRGLSWLPIPVPDGPQARYYTFPVKMLVAHLQNRQQFEGSAGCRTVFLALGELRGYCEKIGSRLIILYAPDQAHAVMPLVRGRLEASELRDFLLLKAKELPAPAATEEMLFRNLEVQEQTVADFCRREGLEFHTLTPDLRAAILRGEQAYYTYDEHWTPTGHRIAAQAVQRYLETSGAKAPPMHP